MRNLAGNDKSTAIVKEELRRVGIRAVPSEGLGEVGSCWAGELNGFMFKRAWYYYVVTGKLPLAKALELHEHPIAKMDVRVCGHCMRPEPVDPWVNYYDDAGVRVLSMEAKADYESHLDSNSLGDICREGLANNRFEVYPETFNGFVESYHIDSEAGLLLFVKAIS